MKKRNTKFLAAAVASAVFVSGYSSRADIITPAGLNPGDHFYVILVTAGTTSAVSSDSSVYNTFVQSQAGGMTYNTQSLSWTALGSYASNPEVDAISLFDPNAPIFLPDGNEVAADGTDFWAGSLLHDIDVDSNGDTVATAENVWTGSYSNGHEANKSGPALYFDEGIGNTYNTDPTTNYVYVGNTGDADVDALGDTDAAMYDITGDAAELPMFAVSEELTVPGAVVPLPQSASLGAAALAALAVEEAVRRLVKSRA